jgi:fucose permease
VLASAGGLAALTALATARTAFPVPKQPHSFPIRQALRLAREEMLLLLGLMAFLESGMEITVGGWTSTFAREALLLSGPVALLFLSLYWLGMMLARLVLGWLLQKVAPRLAVAGSLALAFGGVLMLLYSRATALAALGVFVVGAGFAGIFPVLLSWLGERYQALSGTAFSIALVMALAGGMVLPYLTGVLGERFGMRVSLITVPLALVISASLFVVVNVRRLIPPSTPPETVSR